MMDRIIQVLHVMTLDVATVIRILYILNNVYAQADVDIVNVKLILPQLNSVLMDLVMAMMQRSHVEAQFLCHDEHGSESADCPQECVCM